MTLNDYLHGRRKAIESNIANERLAGNDFKLACEKTALAEIIALERAIACGEIKPHCTACKIAQDNLDLIVENQKLRGEK